MARGGAAITETESAARAWVVLDDDPTGTQAVTGAEILLRWTPDEIAHALKRTPTPVHLLTNSRAYPPARAGELVHEAAKAALEAEPTVQILLRGDSTLRAHLLEEYLAVAKALGHSDLPVLLLVPALPAAGRITVGGIHYLERDGVRTPLSHTEFAADPRLGYTSARLVEWAAERSGNTFRISRSREIPLDELRRHGAAPVRDALIEAAADSPAVVVPDAVTTADLKAIADGLKEALARGVNVITRCAPTFVGVVGGHLATRHIRTPHADRVLVACGSFVPSSTRQLEALLARHPGSLVVLDPAAATAADAATAAANLAAAAASDVLGRAPVAVLATARSLPPATATFDDGMRVAAMLARSVAAVAPPPDLLVAKGGITSAVIADIGLCARSAKVLGPVAPGVALWRVHNRPYIVFPGNVGDDRALATVVDAAIGQPEAT